MPSIRPLTLLLALAATPLFAACAATSSDDDASSDAVNEDEIVGAKVETFRLYGEPNAKPSAFCDMHTRLDLKTASNGNRYATLSEALSPGSACEIAVIPNPRTYRLKKTSDSCGSTIYSATARTKDGAWALELTDHRGRICEDLVPAQIITKETKPGVDHPVVSYSLDRPSKITMEGDLIRTFGLGGENTGKSIGGPEGFFELVLDDAQSAKFVAGRKARVSGTIVTLSGVETENRLAIDADELLVCPAAGTINCMPIVSPEAAPYCGAAARAFYETCPGVTFVD